MAAASGVVRTWLCWSGLRLSEVGVVPAACAVPVKPIANATIVPATADRIFRPCFMTCYALLKWMVWNALRALLPLAERLGVDQIAQRIGAARFQQILAERKTKMDLRRDRLIEQGFVTRTDIESCCFRLAETRG